MYSGGGGHFDLMVVMPPCPCPQTFLCERDYLKNPERIASILYV